MCDCVCTDDFEIIVRLHKRLHTSQNDGMIVDKKNANPIHRDVSYRKLSGRTEPVGDERN